MFGENIELPDGLYICKNQNSLKTILRDMKSVYRASNSK